MPDFVPPVPADYAVKAAEKTPYVLRADAGAAAWVPTLIVEPVTVGSHAVIAQTGRPVFVA